MATDDFKLITERVGPIAAVALLIGTAVGMSIFIVPTQMAAVAGPSIVLAILLSVVPMVLGMLLLLQLGGAIPVAGGAYVYASRLVGPYWGFLGVAVPVMSVWAYLLFAALGFAEYVPVFVELPTLLSVYLLLGAFLVFNYVGVRLAANIQIVLVCLLIAAMITFVVGGFTSFDTANFEPMFPAGEGEPYADGYAPFFLAAVTLYIPFQGFAMIIEIGEELENPAKNIPRVLAVGMALVAVLTIAVIIALVGAVPWEAIAQDGEAVDGGIAAVSEGILPGWAIAFVAIGALVAAATTTNTLYTSYSRTIMRAARDDVIPEFFAGIDDRFGTPNRALLLLGLPPLLAAPLMGPFGAILTVDVLDWLVTVTVTGIFISFMISGVALWNLPKIFPDRYKYSFYRLPMPVLKIVAVGNVVVSAVFMVFVALGAPSALVLQFGWILVMSLLYVYRIRTYGDEDEDLREKMSLLHKHESIGADSSDSSDD
ncbi:amino acid/polyamine/organocation transporter, APC superfamily (TC 2.A.3) [Natronorubrum sediminis]|uniref:Amino acid/polyamine/organocation transporter, APC superfamily (TC 2.A.3) n=1 Tax=Natronorubrum sediminis TaxID=640943 RepID=A0A1H6FLI1_9EURY|nr:APC family permease [Natronorubrum sediminis]SEH10988.1 amino acid/polyamine/organocation transporter, APC superfamily (TC 2.A.3) [Natronorubrum sediminis]